jgi:hypothetical protein
MAKPDTFELSASQIANPRGSAGLVAHADFPFVVGHEVGTGVPAIESVRAELRFTHDESGSMQPQLLCPTCGKTFEHLYLDRDWKGALCATCWSRSRP